MDQRRAATDVGGSIDTSNMRSREQFPHREEVQPPTREQIAEAERLVLNQPHHRGCDSLYDDGFGHSNRCDCWKSFVLAVLAVFPQPAPNAAEDEERIRRDERMRWAIYLWGMDEDTDEPEGAFEEGADMAYHAVAAWLLANIARGFEVSDMPWLDPDLVADAKQKARLLPAHPDSEVHEVDRCIATLATIRDVTPKGDDRG